MFTTGLQRGDTVASTWLARGKMWHPAEICNLLPRTWRSETGHNSAAKRDTMTGALPTREFAAVQRDPTAGVVTGLAAVVVKRLRLSVL